MIKTVLFVIFFIAVCVVGLFNLFGVAALANADQERDKNRSGWVYPAKHYGSTGEADRNKAWVFGRADGGIQVTRWHIRSDGILVLIPKDTDKVIISSNWTIERQFNSKSGRLQANDYFNYVTVGK